MGKEFLADEHVRIGPAPDDNAVDRLRHVVKVFEESKAEDHVVTATTNFYDYRFWTGLTHGDLRGLLARIDELQAMVPYEKEATELRERLGLDA